MGRDMSMGFSEVMIKTLQWEGQSISIPLAPLDHERDTRPHMNEEEFAARVFDPSILPEYCKRVGGGHQRVVVNG